LEAELAKMQFLRLYPLPPLVTQLFIDQVHHQPQFLLQFQAATNTVLHSPNQRGNRGKKGFSHGIQRLLRLKINPS
jgi:hypothetical protein